MTAPQLPDRPGRGLPRVPDTFLSGMPGGPARDAGPALAAAGAEGRRADVTGARTGDPREQEREGAGAGAGTEAGSGESADVPAAPTANPTRTRTPGDTAEEAAGASGSGGGQPVPDAPARPAGPQDPAAGGPEPGDAEPAAGVRPAPALPATERQRLLDGVHHDPHAWLGAHATPEGVFFRALRPYARAVTVVPAGSGDGAGQPVRLRDEGEGFFAGAVPLRAVPEYELLVQYGEKPGDDDVRTLDPYRFLPALGDFDLHLIGEGRHEELWQALGARTMTHEGARGTRFTVWAPNARGVRVTGDFNYWNGTACPMRSLGSTGVWEVFLPGVGDGALYKFEVVRDDGSRVLHADPMARAAEVPPANASVVHTSSYEWDDADWVDRRGERAPHAAPLSVYELHLPSWRPGLTYRRLAEQLPAYVKDLGFTHVELMPCAEHPFGGSWGYQVTGFYAPTARLGGPDDFKFLIDALHCAGIGVLMDWVPAHFPKDEWALARFDSAALYEHPDPARAEHPDWGTLEFDFGRREVRNFLVANAVYWCQEFHIDGLRVDAVASMLYLDYSREEGEWSPNAHGGRENLDAVALLQEMNATVYRRCPGVITAAEESTAWDGVTRATHHVGEGGFGGLGFGFKWNMGWMHDSLEYMAQEPVHRKYHHGEMTFSMVYAYAENYILPISHDEVVHGKHSLVSKMPGDWWQQRASLRAYLGFMWAHPGKQLLFMGQEFAQGAEWSEEHGPDWWLLDPSYSAEPDHRGVRDLVRELNTRYTATPALWQLDTVPEGFSWIEGDAAEDNVFAFLRFDAGGAPLMAVSNFSPVPRTDYRLGVPEAGRSWQEVLNTDELRFGGGDVRNPAPLLAGAVPAHGRPASVSATLPPLATVWFRPVDAA